MKGKMMAKKQEIKRMYSKKGETWARDIMYYNKKDYAKDLRNHIKALRKKKQQWTKYLHLFNRKKQLEKQIYEMEVINTDLTIKLYQEYIADFEAQIEKIIPIGKAKK